MNNKEYVFKGPLNNAYTTREIQSMRFAISEIEDKASPEVVPHVAALEMALKKMERANDWHAIIQDYKN
jgi:hypothetical protein